MLEVKMAAMTEAGAVGLLGLAIGGIDLSILIPIVVSVGTLIVALLRIKNKASDRDLRGLTDLADALGNRLKVVEEGLRLCEGDRLQLGNQIISLQQREIEHLKRLKNVEMESNDLRRDLVAVQQCPLAREGKCPISSTLALA